MTPAINETQILTWPDRARAMSITSHESALSVVEALKGIRELQQAAEAHHRPAIAAADRAHTEALAALKRIRGPLDEAERILKGYAVDWKLQQEREAREAARKEQEAAELRAAIEREAEIERAEAEGASAVEVRAITAMPLMVEPVIARPTPRLPGFSAPETWEATVTNIPALIAYVAANPQFAGWLKVDQSALNQFARSVKGLGAVPGVRFSPKVSGRVAR